MTATRRQLRAGAALAAAAGIPERVARFTEADWADEREDARLTASFDALRDACRPRETDEQFAASVPGILRYYRRQRWRAAQEQWAGAHDMTINDLWRLL